MSGYAELRDLGIQFGPFDGPPPQSLGVTSPFSAGWGETVELLARELRFLDAAQIVVEIEGLTPSDLRIDGLPRANAKLGDAVRISFNSKYGPLRYETGRFTRTWWRSASLDGWQVNLRAVGLALEALRKVDRYGITKRGEQYTGWKQLPASTDPADAIVDSAQAAAVLFGASGMEPFLITNPEQLKAVARAAARRTHPDMPEGDETEFRKVQRARELLGV